MTCIKAIVKEDVLFRQRSMYEVKKGIWAYLEFIYGYLPPEMVFCHLVDENSKAFHVI